MRPSENIIADINEFGPQDDNWLRLDALLNELWETGEQEKFTKDLLRVFERFPEEDGNGVLWSIIHGLETFMSYEKELVDSLRRQPSEMGFIMLKRVKNSGSTTMGGVEINTLIADLRLSKQLTHTLKERIEKILYINCNWGEDCKE